MTEPTPPKRPTSPSTEAQNHPSRAPSDEHAEVPQVAASTPTKYNVLPPPPQLEGASVQLVPPTISNVQPFPVTPTVPSAPQSAVAPGAQIFSNTQPTPMAPPLPSASGSELSYIAQRLASARAKLTALKQASPPAVASQPQDPNVEVFDITHLKTIKCDVCQLKNSDILYKCQNCTFHHQICSYCVESTDPKPPDGSPSRKDWSVHAKLKDAHAAYKQPNCPGKKEDGNYEHDGVKFVVLQGKKGGVKKPRSVNPKRDVTPTERNEAISRAIGKHKTTEQGRRILAMATAKLESGQSAELKERIEAARARRNVDTEVQIPAEDRKRKAYVLDDEHEDEDSGKNGGEDVGERAEEKIDEDEWDVVETETAIQRSIFDNARLCQSSPSNQSIVQHTYEPLFGTFLSRPYVSSLRYHRLSTWEGHSSVRQGSPRLVGANRTSIEDRSGSQNMSIKGRKMSLRVFDPLLSSSSHRHPPTQLPKSKMKITTRNSRQRRAIRHPSISLLEPCRNRDPETEFSSDESSFDSIDEEDQPEHLDETPVTPPRQQIPQQIEERQDQTHARQELQYITSEDDTDEDPDPYAEDRRGIALLLQAANAIEDPERAQIQQQQERTMQFDGSAEDHRGIDLLLQAAHIIEDRERAQSQRQQETFRKYDGSAADLVEAQADAEYSSSPSTDESDESFIDASEFDRRSPADAAVSPPPHRDIPKPTMTRILRTRSKEPHGHKRRRSERLRAASTSTTLLRRSSRRHRSEQPRLKRRKHSSPKATIAVETTTPTPVIPCAADVANEAVRSRIRAIHDHAAALSRSRVRPNWTPSVREYVKEQRIKKRKKRAWLDRQSRKQDRGKQEEEGSDEDGDGDGSEDEYDEGVEGGFWVYSSSSIEENGDADESGEVVGRGGRGVEIRDSQDDDDDDDEDEDPIVGPGARRRGRIPA